MLTGGGGLSKTIKYSGLDEYLFEQHSIRPGTAPNTKRIEYLAYDKQGKITLLDNPDIKRPQHYTAVRKDGVVHMHYQAAQVQPKFYKPTPPLTHIAHIPTTKVAIKAS